MSHDPRPVHTAHQLAMRATYASLAPDEHVTQPREGGHVVQRHTAGSLPGTVLVENVRAFDAEGRSRAIDADPTWRIRYRIPGHDVVLIDERHVGEAFAAAAFERLTIRDPGVTPA